MTQGISLRISNILLWSVQRETFLVVLLLNEYSFTGKVYHIGLIPRTRTHSLPRWEHWGLAGSENACWAASLSSPPFTCPLGLTDLLCWPCRDEENFCATVPKDGRSYSPTLFAQTVRVLKKINKPGNMIVAFSNLAEKVKVRKRVYLLTCPLKNHIIRVGHCGKVG